MKQTTKSNIKNHIKAGYPALYLVTHEDQRVEAEIKSITSELNYALAAWAITSGVVDANGGGATQGTEAPESAIEWFDGAKQKTILVLSDFHMFMREPDPVLIRSMKESLWRAKNSHKTIIIIGCKLNLPQELEKLITVIEYELPDREAISAIMHRVAEENEIKIEGDEADVVNAATGLSTTEAEDAFALSAVECGSIKADIVQREKSATIKKNGLLEVVDVGAGIESIGGLDDLKQWISKRRNAFSDEARKYGLPMPKGILLIGSPGVGKSMISKAIARVLNVPLLKLDCGNLFAGIVGESEANTRRVIQTAEAVAPCCLMLDEIEKSLSGSQSSGHTDGGTSARVLGTFLAWLNDHTSPVFVVATSNDVTKLPPELLRKGRFDELIFVDLPNRDERKDIWRIQIIKHGRKLKGYDMERLSGVTDGWTGAEIESLFREALFAAFDIGKEPTTDMLEDLSCKSVPLSKTMAEQIEGLRKWADGRARRATSIKVEEVKAGRKITV